MRRLFRHPEAVTLALLAIAFAAGALQSPYFLDATYLLDASTLHVETGLLALGMTFVIVGGQIDLSVASNMALSACLVAIALEAGLPMPLAILLGPAAGAALGAINGLVVVWARLPSFVVTLGTMALYRGVAQILLGPSSVALPKEFAGFDRLGVGPVPTSLIALLAIAAALGLLLHRGVFGRRVFAIGANEEAALYSGIPVARAKVAVFALCGMLCGLAALHLDSRLGVSRFDLARGAELDAITAVVLGGASIYGGRGSILGTVLALFLLAVLKTGMGLANVKAEYQLAAIGALLILAVLSSNALLSRRPA